MPALGKQNLLYTRTGSPMKWVHIYTRPTPTQGVHLYSCPHCTHTFPAGIPTLRAHLYCETSVLPTHLPCAQPSTVRCSRCTAHTPALYVRLPCAHDCPACTPEQCSHQHSRHTCMVYIPVLCPCLRCTHTCVHSRPGSTHVLCSYLLHSWSYIIPGTAKKCGRPQPIPPSSCS